MPRAQQSSGDSGPERDFFTGAFIAESRTISPLAIPGREPYFDGEGWSNRDTAIKTSVAAARRTDRALNEASWLGISISSPKIQVMTRPIYPNLRPLRPKL